VATEWLCPEGCPILKHIQINRTVKPAALDARPLFAWFHIWMTMTDWMRSAPLQYLLRLFYGIVSVSYTPKERISLQ
jgi:hypothetical protein